MLLPTDRLLEHMRRNLVLVQTDQILESQLVRLDQLLLNLLVYVVLSLLSVFVCWLRLELAHAFLRLLFLWWNCILWLKLILLWWSRDRFRSQKFETLTLMRVEPNHRVFFLIDILGLSRLRRHCILGVECLDPSDVLTVCRNLLEVLLGALMILVHSGLDTWPVDMVILKKCLLLLLSFRG